MRAYMGPRERRFQFKAKNSYEVNFVKYSNVPYGVVTAGELPCWATSWRS